MTDIKRKKGRIHRFATPGTVALQAPQKIL